MKAYTRGVGLQPNGLQHQFHVSKTQVAFLCLFFIKPYFSYSPLFVHTVLAAILSGGDPPPPHNQPVPPRLPYHRKEKGFPSLERCAKDPIAKPIRSNLTHDGLDCLTEKASKIRGLDFRSCGKVPIIRLPQ